MEVLNIAFHLVSFLLAFLAASLLLWINKERKHSNRLLAFVLIIFAIQNLMLILLFSRLILEVPWLLRVFAPTTFLSAPAGYIYIRSVLNEEFSYKKYDWLFLIPAILVIFNFIPYYLLSNDEKLAVLNKSFYSNFRNLDQGRGMLPGNIYYLIRVIWSAFCLYMGFRMIFQFRKKKSSNLVAKNKKMLNWLFVFNCLLTAILVETMLKIFLSPIYYTQLSVSDILIGATILIINIQLFLRPYILYGIFQPLPKIRITNEIFTTTDVLPTQIFSLPASLDGIACEPDEDAVTIMNTEQETQFRYKKLVETYFREKKPFLKPEYSLDHLVADTNIPRYILSAFINREYGMGFREFLNRYRVEYMKENLEKKEWKQFTLEAIATECGFNSRTTFIKNFKEITGQTPSDYIKTILGKGHL